MPEGKFRDYQEISADGAETREKDYTACGGYSTKCYRHYSEFNTGSTYSTSLLRDGGGTPTSTDQMSSYPHLARPFHGACLLVTISTMNDITGATLMPALLLIASSSYLIMMMKPHRSVRSSIAWRNEISIIKQHICPELRKAKTRSNKIVTLGIMANELAIVSINIDAL
ncbi:hypothetical protein KM043_016248 [Ampulex compressa]|nr:hypothetical protein KM043_016248 [Ampulex compressa]